VIISSLVAALKYTENLDIAWQPTLLVVALAAIGTWIGSLIADKYSSKHLQRVFSLMLTIMAGWMVCRTFTGL